MTLEALRAITPYISLLLAIVIGVLGFLLRVVYSTLSARVAINEERLAQVDKEHQLDQRALHERFVDRDSYLMTVGETKGTINRIFDQLNVLSATLNQTIGAISGKKSNE